MGKIPWEIFLFIRTLTQPVLEVLRTPCVPPSPRAHAARGVSLPMPPSSRRPAPSCAHLLCCVLVVCRERSDRVFSQGWGGGAGAHPLEEPRDWPAPGSRREQGSVAMWSRVQFPPNRQAGPHSGPQKPGGCGGGAGWGGGSWAGLWLRRTNQPRLPPNGEGAVNRPCLWGARGRHPVLEEKVPEEECGAGTRSAWGVPPALRVSASPAAEGRGRRSQWPGTK